MECHRLDTRLGALAWRESGSGPPLVFFAGALANGDLWRDVVAALEDRYRCITVDLPLGAHPWPLAEGADRSALSLARLLPDCLEPLDVEDATVVANDTAGGLLLLALGTDHPALARVGRLVLTNCESYDQFPPDALKKASALSRRAPRVARAAVRLTAGGRRGLSTVTARGLDDERAESFFAPVRRDPRIADDLVAAMAGFRPQLLLDAAAAIPGSTGPSCWPGATRARSSRSRTGSGSPPTSPTRRWCRCPRRRRGCRSTIRPRWPRRSPHSCRWRWASGGARARRPRARRRGRRSRGGRASPASPARRPRGRSPGPRRRSGRARAARGRAPRARC